MKSVRNPFGPLCSGGGTTLACNMVGIYRKFMAGFEK